MSLSLAAIHRLIQLGELRTAQNEIERRLERNVSRKDAARLASFAVRCGVPGLGVRLLHRIVRPPSSRAIEATAAEKAEYGYALVKCGAWEEGMGVLSQVSTKEYSPTLFYLAMGHVAAWDYSASVPLLKAYLQTPSLDHYGRLVAQVNLAAALVFLGKLPAAEMLLRELLHVSRIEGYKLMQARVLELHAELLVVKKAWGAALQFLEEAQKQVSPDVLDAFLVRKLKAIVLLYESAGSTSARRALESARAEARRRAHWETIRQCDWAESVVLRDENLFLRLYFGTPFEAFREKLVVDYGPMAKDRLESYSWGSGTKATLDLTSGRLSSSKKPGLVPGGVLHRLLHGLLSDFYRPASMAALHARVHPDCRFHPDLSRGALHEAIGRLRRWFADSDLPLEIEEAKGHYQLVERRPFRITIVRDSLQTRRYGNALRELKDLTGDSPFSITEGMRWTELPRRTLARVLADAVEDGILDRSGKGPSTRYRFGRNNPSA